VDGPLLASDAAVHALQQPGAASWGELRLELLAFLRSVVRGGASASLGLYEKGALTFRAAGRPGGRVALGAEGSVRDLVILQLVVLLHEIGFGQVRECRDVKCRRLFIRRYRKDFCSGKCQKRVHTHLARLAERERLRREQEEERQEDAQRERERQLRRRRAR
jgi:hypothetical protein